ncbi:hypothetical protein DPMN_023819 [Dreissena polymorpha]|uniref:Uncharacterized protein n=1 Tax=Dreissena polymorpha TaxID=45954 RepID=A0A9D4RA86_DREPO|nr:hypothetical protein DPMN_023819 [Dreissena polymorpha]
MNSVLHCSPVITTDAIIIEVLIVFFQTTNVDLNVSNCRESDRDGRLNSYYGGPFKPVEPNYTRPFRLGDPDSTWDRNGHVPGMKGKSGSLPDINDHVDMRLARERRRLSYQRDPDPLYSSPKKEKYPPPTQKPMDNYKQNMVRVFPESGERLPRARNSQFPRNTGNGRISPEPDYHAPPRSPKPDYHDKRSRDRLYASNDSGLVRRTFVRFLIIVISCNDIY